MHIHCTASKSYLRPLTIAVVSMANFLIAADTQPVQTTPPSGIKLSQKWDTAMREGNAVMAEIRGLLSGSAQPAANLSASPGAAIYRSVTYLMPLEDARKALGLIQKVNSKMLVITPGFPNRSIYAYSFSGNFDGFETMYLVTDLMDQVVAVELLTARVRKTDLSPHMVKKEWRTYDFVNGSTKAITGAEVRHETSSSSGSIQIDSVFAVPTKDRTASYSPFNYTTVEPVSGTRLFIAKPFAELILYRISKCGI